MFPAAPADSHSGFFSPRPPNWMSDELDIAGPRGSHTGCDAELYASASPAVPAPGIPRRVAKAKREHKAKYQVALIRKEAKTLPWIQPTDLLIVPPSLGKIRVAIKAVHEKLQQQGYFDEHGDPKPAIDLLRRLILAEERLAASLGLTARSRLEMQPLTREKRANLTAKFA
jgi:hypothetical protein